VKRQRSAHLKVQRLQNPEFHLADFLGSVRVVGDVHKVVDFRGVHLFHLASREHGGDPKELEPVPFDGQPLRLQVPVNQEDGHVQGFWQKLEL